MVILLIIFSITFCEICENSFFDIVFLVDASGSISGADFPKCITFVHDVGDELPISEDRVKASVIMFSGPGVSKLKIAFDGAGKDKKEFLDKTDVNNPDCIGRNPLRRATDLHTSLDHAFEVLFTQQSTRYNILTGEAIARVVIILTDGQTMNEPQDVKNAVKLKDKDTIIYGIGVGSSVDQAHIRSLCSKDEYYHQLSNFDSLNSIVKSLADSFPCSPSKKGAYPVALVVVSSIIFVGTGCCWVIMLLLLLLFLCCLICGALFGLLSGVSSLLVGDLASGNPLIVPVEKLKPAPPMEESMYFIGGKQTAVNWGKEGMNFDSPYRPGDMGMGEKFGKEVGLPEYKKLRGDQKPGTATQGKKKGWCPIL